jgi:hypothetical protein
MFNFMNLRYFFYAHSAEASNQATEWRASVSTEPARRLVKMGITAAAAGSAFQADRLKRLAFLPFARGTRFLYLERFWALEMLGCAGRELLDTGTFLALTALRPMWGRMPLNHLPIVRPAAAPERSSAVDSTSTNIAPDEFTREVDEAEKQFVALHSLGIRPFGQVGGVLWNLPNLKTDDTIYHPVRCLEIPVMRSAPACNRTDGIVPTGQLRDCSLNSLPCFVIAEGEIAPRQPQ